MKKILLFDDEEAIRMLYEDELLEEGYDVISSGDASQWMELIREHCPDVVLMDRKMGKLDGLEVLHKIGDQFPGLPLILCTAYLSHVSEKDEAVAICYASKSYDLKDLKMKIKAAVEVKTVT